jgi:hypothetical protein|tara:strand:- start:593 stop:775 length:183 start_codon:yes stop_codon:yes gene_type:complete
MNLKDKQSTVSYNLLLPIEQYNIIKKMSIDRSMKSEKMVSMAEIIRQMIDEVIVKYETRT